MDSLLRHWQLGSQERETYALKEIENDLSLSVKQAIRAECARKSQMVKAEYEHSAKIANQQLADFQSLASTEKSGTFLTMIPALFAASASMLSMPVDQV